jgi:hypothetical protein
MIFFVFNFLVLLDAGDIGADAPPHLFGVCAIYARYFHGIAYEPDLSFWNVMSSIETQGLSFLQADFQALRNSDFIDLYLSQEEYCQQSEVSTLASQVADGTHENSVEIWNSCVFELLEASVLLSSFTAGRRNLDFFENLGKAAENLGTAVTGISADDRDTQATDSNPLRNVAVPPIQLGMPSQGAVGHMIESAADASMRGEIEVAAPQAFAPHWMHTWGWYGAMIFALLMLAAAIGAMVNEAFRRHGRRKLESTPSSSSLNDLSIDMGNIAESCHLRTGSFICAQPLYSISEMMQVAICGGAASKISCVLDGSLLQDFVHNGVQQGRRMLATGTNPVVTTVMSTADTALNQTDLVLNATGSFIGIYKLAFVLVFGVVAMLLTHRMMRTKQRGFSSMEQIV